MMGKHRQHCWYLAKFQFAGQPHNQDLTAFAALVLARTGLGVISSTENTAEEAVITALLAGQPKHTTLTPPPGPYLKHNLEKRLQKLACSALFAGTLKDPPGNVRWRVDAASSSNITLIQTILRSEDRQFTGFTLEQLQQLAADPVCALGLEYTLIPVTGREGQFKKVLYSKDTDQTASQHAASVPLQGGTRATADASGVDSNAAREVPADHLAAADAPSNGAADDAAGSLGNITPQHGAAAFVLPDLGPYKRIEGIFAHTRVPVTQAMLAGVYCHPVPMHHRDVVVMPDGSIITLLPSQVLGTGGFSRVVAGIWAGREIEVAVKMPADKPTIYAQPGQTPDKDIWYDNCFLPELRALQAAGPHEYLLKCHGWGMHWGSGMPVIVFDRAACSLEARKPILADTSTYFHQLLCVMQHLHARGVWHRDIKPGNLLLAGTGPNGRLVLQLADLGISRVAHVPNGAQPTGIGTQPYMAPEQQDPSLAPGDGCWAKADVWSAGVALLEMVGGWVQSGMADKAFSLSAYTSSSPGAAGGVVTGVAADACAGSNSSRARRRASKRAASVSAYKDSTAFLKNELERILEYLEDKQPGVAQQLELLEDLLCRMLVVDPEQRPAAGDLLDHPFFELGRVGRQLHTAG